VLVEGGQTGPNFRRLVRFRQIPEQEAVVEVVTDEAITLEPLVRIAGRHRDVPGSHRDCQRAAGMGSSPGRHAEQQGEDDCSQCASEATGKRGREEQIDLPCGSEANGVGRIRGHAKSVPAVNPSALYAENSPIDRILPFDATPRVIAAAEWQQIETGIIQRITALNLLLDDLMRTALSGRSAIWIETQP